jgi:thiosulfate dehydrogenase [quinone] large subunit
LINKELIMNKKIRTILQRELQRENGYLLPLRLFIGLGWTRAGLEKLMDTGWHSGSSLTAFFTGQLDSGMIYFPFYEWLATDLFMPHAQLLSWIVIVGQLLAGLAIGMGLFTNPALLGGLFMNLNFLFIGRVNPSAFYIVIQVTLLSANAGMVLGLDALAVRRMAIKRVQNRQLFLLLAIGLWVIALLVMPYIRDYSPHSVGDPAMLLFIMFILGGLSSVITFIRLSPPYTIQAGTPASSAKVRFQHQLSDVKTK